MSIWRRYRYILVAAIFILGALILFSLSAGRSLKGMPLEPYIVEITGPVQSLLTSAGESLGSVWNNYFTLVYAAKKNQKLKKEISALRSKLTAMEELRLANQRYRALLGLKEQTHYQVMAAEVVATDSSNFFRNLILNKGSAGGVLTHMPVVDTAGLVGRVVWVGPHYCKVLLLTDPNFGADVMVQRSRTKGVVTGAGQGKLIMKYVQDNKDVTAGDALVTSGAAGVFPRGVLVGKVVSVEERGQGAFLRVEVQPAVDFSRLEEVLIIMKERRKVD